MLYWPVFGLLLPLLLLLNGRAVYAESFPDLEEPAAAEVPLLGEQAEPEKSAAETPASRKSEQTRPALSNEDVNYRFGSAEAPESRISGDWLNPATHAARLGLMLSYKTFSGLLGYDYSPNAFIVAAIQGSYRSQMQVGANEQEYGPLASLRLRLANPLRMIPYYDLGLGYFTWLWQESSGAAQQLQRLTQVERVGLSLQLAKHFAVVVQQTRLRFLDTEPLAEESPLSQPKLLQVKRLEVLFEFLL